MILNSILLQESAAGGGAGMMNILMIVALIAIFYFFMIRPQSKKQKEIKKFREGLEAGSKVITAGGIYGKIKEIKENYIILEIADNVRIKIDKGSVYPSATEVADAAANNDTKKA
ncbi:MAG: preprotein translocase subunit YajC [Muribaculaceae bacterium]|nr:preprotein translocase subunit YajC [Muribaculaceae bacterium]